MNSDEMSKRVLLIGNPNVGKSAFFSRVTGINVLSSNYPGTTIGFSEGFFKVGEEIFRLTDVPGAYTLYPTNEAEEVAKRIIDAGADYAILVIDATALERNLFLAFQVLQRGIPSIIALNMWDEARHKGISVNIHLLEQLLGVPVVPTVAVSGAGFKELIDRLKEAKASPSTSMNKSEIWSKVGEIVENVQRVTHRHHTWVDRLEHLTVRPKSGAIAAILVISLFFWLVRNIGEGLIDYVADPLFDNIWLPVLQSLSEITSAWPIIHNMLVGELVNGRIDFVQGMGLLSTGLYVEFGMVLPYILAFYGMLGLLEDIGYLPRMAIIFDSLLHRLGMHGYAIIPTFLGLGCNVPGILATRVLESQRERFIAATLISIAIPCASLQAMIIGLVGEAGMKYLALVYGTLFAVWVTIGCLLNKLLPSYSPELVVEIPPYRMPMIKPFAQKMWFRVREFILEATPLVLLGVFLLNILYYINFFDPLARLTAPFFEGYLGLPKESVAPLLVSFLRKDVAVGLLAPLGLTSHQLVVAVLMMSMTFPCVATLIVLFKELGEKMFAASMAIMISAALITGGLAHFMLTRFGI